MKANIRIPVTKSPDHEYYDVPNASKYLIRDDGLVYRKLATGKLRQLKQFHVERKDRRLSSNSDLQTTVRTDDGKPKTIYPKVLLASLHKAKHAQRELPGDYLDLPDLWVRYYVNKNGDVLQSKTDIFGEMYFEPVPWKQEKPNGLYKLDRVLIRNFEFTRRSYTRQQLQDMYKQRMETLVNG